MVHRAVQPKPFHLNRITEAFFMIMFRWHFFHSIRVLSPHPYVVDSRQLGRLVATNCSLWCVLVMTPSNSLFAIVTRLPPPQHNPDLMITSRYNKKHRSPALKGLFCHFASNGANSRFGKTILIQTIVCGWDK